MGRLWVCLETRCLSQAARWTASQGSAGHPEMAADSRAARSRAARWTARLALGSACSRAVLADFAVPAESSAVHWGLRSLPGDYWVALNRGDHYALVRQQKDCLPARCRLHC